MSEFGVAELERRLNNLIRLGQVEEIDHQRARVRVRSGKMLSAWLPWQTGRAGTTRVWSPPSIGEHVLLFSPGGNTVSAVAVSSLFSAGSPPLRQSGDVWAIEMPDGAVIEYNHAVHHLQATLPGSATLDTQGDVTVTTAAKVTATAAGGAIINADVVINGDTTINGNLSFAGGQTATMNGDVNFVGKVTSNGKDISSSHRHGDVEPGGGQSGDVL